jgi:heme oxygenase
MSAVPDNEVRGADEREEPGARSPLLEQLRGFHALVARQSEATLEVERALGRSRWQRYLPGPRSPRRRAASAAQELEELQAAPQEAAARLSRTALSESGETPASRVSSTTGSG